MKNDRLVLRFRDVLLDCDTWCSLSRERDMQINVLQAFLATFLAKLRLLEGEIELFCNEKNAVRFVQNVCSAKVGSVIDTLPGGSTYVRKRLNVDGVR